MKSRKLFFITVLLGVSFGGSAQAVVIGLYDSCLDVDGTFSNTLGGGTSAFDCPLDFGSQAGLDGSGLGTVTVNVSGVGSHYVSLFVDHEIDEETNGYLNEYGEISGTPAAGQTWELDEPGFVFGDIFDNFAAETLDTTNGVPISTPDDVSMALAWNFTLGAGETATIDFLLSALAPESGFWLAHVDPDSVASIYFSSTLTIDLVTVPESVPEPGTLALLGIGLLGMGLARRNKKA